MLFRTVLLKSNLHVQLLGHVLAKKNDSSQINIEYQINQLDVNLLMGGFKANKIT